MAIAAIRTVLIYLLLILALRLSGKRQIGELQSIELVVTFLISDLAVIPIQDTGTPLLHALIPITVLISLELIFSVVMMKSALFSTLINGNPVVVIRCGIIDQDAMRKLRLGVDDLTEALRQQGVFDVTKVDCAIAETNGKISVLQLSDKQQAFVPIVQDGKTVKWGLSFCEITPEWIQKKLNKHHCRMRDVLLMTADTNQSYHIIRKERSS